MFCQPSKPYTTLHVHFVPACNGTFGQGCANQCGQCKDDVPCDVIDGTCPEGCAPGWVLNNCAQSKLCHSLNKQLIIIVFGIRTNVLLKTVSSP